MPDCPDQLHALARQTGLSLYCFAGIAFVLCVQVIAHGVAEYSAVLRVLFILGTGLMGIFLPIHMILMGSQLRAAARASAGSDHSPHS